MRDFLTLFKYEFKLQFPHKGKNQKFDLVGNLTSLLISALIIFVFIYLISTIATNYVLVEIDKIENPVGRTFELMNAFYLGILSVMGLLGVERMRKSLTEKKDKEIFLRLPVKPQTIFLSKLAVLLLMDYILAFLLIFPTNAIFYIALKPEFTFWLMTAVVWLIVPIIGLFISSLLIVPYIKIINYIKDKYLIIFVLFTGLLVGAFMMYSVLLEVVRRLLETGHIKFLFNAKFIDTLQVLSKFTYPANSLASLVLLTDVVQSVIILSVLLIISVLFIYYITNKLFYITLYKNEERNQKGKVVNTKRMRSQLVALMKKEFISIFREPKNLFSYFSISLSMPIMVYCCYTLFDSLIMNTVGFKIDFALALLIILVFSVLTNTFCSTNISRDGLSSLKIKSMPVRASKVLMAKVLFCSIVSSLAVILSSILLVSLTNLSPVNGIICSVLGIFFSLAQILISTRMDLNHAKPSLSNVEMERESSKTIAKVIFIGLIIALITGLLAIVVTIFTKGNTTTTIANLNLKSSYTYLIPAILCALYFVFGFVYYKINVEKRYTDFVI